MNQHRRDQIARLAESVRSACELSTPIDVEEAVRKLRGKIMQVDDADFEAKIERDGDGFGITLGSQLYVQRRRFSVAHELGHLFLHMGYLIDEEKWRRVGTYTDSVYYRFGYSTEEYEANEFAAALLMPKQEFVQIAARCRSADEQVRAAAEHFEVSLEAAANRGRWLGLFSWG